MVVLCVQFPTLWIAIGYEMEPGFLVLPTLWANTVAKLLKTGKFMDKNEVCRSLL